MKIAHRELPAFYEARTRMQVWIGNVPVSMDSRSVALHLQSNGYGTPFSVCLNREPWAFRDTQWAVVTFWNENDAAMLRLAGSKNRRALLWTDGRCAVIRPAQCRGIIPGDRHHKAGGYAAQKASKRQCCG